VSVISRGRARLLNGNKSGYQNETYNLYGLMPNYNDKTRLFIVKYNVNKV